MKSTIAETDVKKILTDDGVKKVLLNEHNNKTRQSFSEIYNSMFGISWSSRVAFNKHFGCTFICQLPGEGNRMHYHPDADEVWVIMRGILEWEIDGVIRVVSDGDVVVVKEGVKHRIKNIGNVPAVRLAIYKPDVEHVYETED